MNPTITKLYNEYRDLTGSAEAAATLVLAQQFQSSGLSERQPESLSVEQAAHRLGVSRGIVYRLCQDGLMPHNKVGKRITITPEHLAEYQSSPSPASQLRHV